MSEARKFYSESTRGYLHEPKDATGAGMILTHGAGGNCRSALLVSIAAAFAAGGVWVLRYDLPFRQRRAFGPPFGSGSEDRQGLSRAARELRRIAFGPLYLSGHSYGGRQASILAVEETAVCDSLLLLSFPLHPPKEPHNLRTSHFGQLPVPVLFVHGTRDPFGSVEELRAAAEAIPVTAAIAPIENAGHDLLKGNFDIEKHVSKPFRAIVASRK